MTNDLSPVVPSSKSGLRTAAMSAPVIVARFWFGRGTTQVPCPSHTPAPERHDVPAGSGSYCQLSPPGQLIVLHSRALGAFPGHFTVTAASSLPMLDLSAEQLSKAHPRPTIIA